MARKRIAVNKIKSIIQLKTAGNLSDRQIARALSIGRPAVAKYWTAFLASGLASGEIADISDSQAQTVLGNEPKHITDRYKTLIGLFPDVVKELGKRGVTLAILWEEYRSGHPNGYGYSQFCFHFSLWRRSCELSMHMDHKPGDKMFVDYAGDHLYLTDRLSGEKTSVETYVAVLGASGLAYAEGSMSQGKDDWIRSNERAFLYFGGVSAAIVPDNLKSAVSKSDRYDPEINPTFRDFADYYGTVILPARVKKPQDKALVENAVKLVYQRIYAPLRNRTFFTLDDLNKAIRELLDVHNNRKFQGLPYSRRELFEETEKGVLGPLPTEKYPHKTFQHAKVQFNYHVFLKEDRNYYSVPYYLREGKKECAVLLVYDDRTVSIYYDNIRIASHFRTRTMNKYTTSDDHMPPAHRFVKNWSPERFREWAEEYGPEVYATIDRALASFHHPEQAYKTCMGILAIRKSHGLLVLSRACKKANEHNIHSCRRIRSIADRIKYDDAQPQLEWAKAIPHHDNVRGSTYYS